MKSLGDVTAINRLIGSIQSCELSTYYKYIFTLYFASNQALDLTLDATTFNPK